MNIKRRSILRMFANMALVGTGGALLFNDEIRKLEEPGSEDQQQVEDKKSAPGQEQDKPGRIETHPAKIAEIKVEIEKLAAGHYGRKASGGFVIPLFFETLRAGLQSKENIQKAQTPHTVSRKNFLMTFARTGLYTAIYGVTNYKTAESDLKKTGSDIYDKDLVKVRELIDRLPEEERERIINEIMVKSSLYVASGIALGKMTEASLNYTYGEAPKPELSQ